jgi:hypothetical protein
VEHAHRDLALLEVLGEEFGKLGVVVDESKRLGEHGKGPFIPAFRGYPNWPAAQSSPECEK